MDEVPQFAIDAAAKVSSEPLAVLVMGPGAHSTGGTKRKQILEFIASLPSGDSVMFPETAIEKIPTLADLETHDAERVLLSNVDAVVMLLVEDLKVTGPETELAQFTTSVTQRQKFFVIEPRAYTERVESNAPYQLLSLKALHSQQRFSYTDEQLESCAAIRDRVRQWLNRIRYEKLVNRDEI